MRKFRTLSACVLVPVIMAGCASTTTDEMLEKANEPMAEPAGLPISWCVIGGALAGGVGGAAIGGWSGIAGAVGGLSGAVMGEVLCGAALAEEMMKDSDGDGVSDDKDQCPGTPAGVAVDAVGCPLYTDADDVPDYLDKCPGTPAGVKVDKDGCPLDSDGDGVADYLDKCPNTPKGTAVDSSGCPVGAAGVSIVTNINFDFDSAAIREDSKEKLARVISILKENPGVKVKVVGYTDSTGPAAYNLALSLRRAESVKNYMVARGIADSRLLTDGKGEADPLVSNATREGRAVNRRVEFVTM